MKKIIYLSVALMTLSACSQDEVEATDFIKGQSTKEILIEKRAQYLKENTEELRLKLSECREMTRQDYIDSSECISVSRATAYLGW